MKNRNLRVKEKEKGINRDISKDGKEDKEDSITKRERERWGTKNEKEEKDVERI